MPLAYAPEEVKERLNSVLAYGDKAEIIARTRLNSTLIKEMFNEACDRNNQFANVLEIFTALHDLDPDRGDLLVETFISLYESSKRRRQKKHLSIEDEAVKLAQAGQQVALDQLSHASEATMLADSMKAQRQAERTTEAIISHMAPAVTEWRAAIRDRVNNRRER
jgi:hypothetical protein